VPVLAPLCSCGSATREVCITPPGDARPAFPYDIRFINNIFEETFGGNLIPDGTLVLLNKAPDPDRMEEIIIGGAVVGAIRYDTKKQSWEALPRIYSYSLVKPKKRYIIVDDGAVTSIRDDGSSLLAPGLVFIDPHVRAGDEVYLVSKNMECIGVGRAKVDAKTALTMKKGSIVRTRKNAPAVFKEGNATWDDAVRSNQPALDEFVSSSCMFIENVVNDNPNLCLTISYSGGKDSLATLLLVLQVVGKVPMLFADTGFEFKETYENIEKVSKLYDLPVIRTDGNTKFWERFNEEGPPARNFRWCCRVCKLNPLSEIINAKIGNCLTFVGQRKYESQTRKQSPRVWRNRNIPAQLACAPIQHWTALHVWLYIMQEKAPYNILYEQGLDRIGCYMCPSSDLGVIEHVKQSHPQLWCEWEEKVIKWGIEHGFQPGWAENGGWRIRGQSGYETDNNC